MTATRDVREIIRDEPLIRSRIVDALAEGPLTVPELAAALGFPEREVMFWVMGLRKYGHVAEVAAPAEDGYFRYQAVER